jgi:hypothetical protein
MAPLPMTERIWYLSIFSGCCCIVLPEMRSDRLAPDHNVKLC